MSTGFRLPPRDSTSFPPRPNNSSTARDGDLAFLEFVTCQICNIHFQGGERAFYITSCGHIFCSDERHNHREGTCTACKGKAAIHRLEESLPSAVKSYFQAPKSLLSSINNAVGALNFQQQQLARVTRAQRRKIAEYDALVGDLTSTVKALQEDEANSKRQLEGLTRQLHEERAQHRRLQQQYAELERRAMEVPTPQSHGAQRLPPAGYPMRSGSRQSTGPYTTPHGRSSARPGQSLPLAPMYEPRAHQERYQRETKRNRDSLDGAIPPSLGKQMHPEYPARPSTGMPAHPSSLSNVDIRRTRSTAGYDTRPPLRTNLDQYRYKEDMESPGPTQLSPTKPSFTLARPNQVAQPNRWQSVSRNERPSTTYGRPHDMMMIPEEDNLC